MESLSFMRVNKSNPQIDTEMAHLAAINLLIRFSGVPL